MRICAMGHMWIGANGGSAAFNHLRGFITVPFAVGDAYTFGVSAQHGPKARKTFRTASCRYRPDLPIWFISGEEDPCMGSKKKFLSSVCFLQERGYGEVSYRLYPGLRHEILNERGKERIFAEIAEKLREWNRRAGAEEKPC